MGSNLITSQIQVEYFALDVRSVRVAFTLLTQRVFLDEMMLKGYVTFILDSMSTITVCLINSTGNKNDL